MDLLPLLAVGGSVIILASCLTLTNPNHKAKKDKENYLRKLDTLIDQKTIELFNLRDRVDNNRVDTRFNLTNLEMKVLDIYDNSNIQIPIDIIEELRRQQLEDDADIFHFIESQRKYWKLENSKVPFRKKESK